MTTTFFGGESGSEKEFHLRGIYKILEGLPCIPSVLKFCSA